MSRTSSEKRGSERLPMDAKSDNKYDFIVFKQVSDKPLYDDQERSRRFSSKLQDEILYDSVLAFGGMRRVRRSSSKAKDQARSTSTSTTRSSASSRKTSIADSGQSTYSDRSRCSSSSSLSSFSSATSSTQSTYSVGSRGSATTSEAVSRTATISSDDAYSQAETERYEDWRAFRAKYEQRKSVEQELPFGRFGPGRGYIEYRHRRSCDGNCEGACFGK